MKLIFIRHGQTKLNSEGRIRGWKDVPLDAEGKAAANELGVLLKDESIDAIFCSDLSRAKETAEIVSKHTGAPILDITEELRPWNVGDYTEQTSEVAGPIMQKYIEDTPDEPLPNGESFDNFKARFLGYVTHLLSEYGNKNIAIVAHHRNERCLYGWVKDGQNGFEIDPKEMKIEGLVPGSALIYEQNNGVLTEEKPEPKINKKEKYQEFIADKDSALFFAALDAFKKLGAIRPTKEMVNTFVNYLSEDKDFALYELLLEVQKTGAILKGEKGDRGLDGRNGADGKNGKDGKPGKDGRDGRSGLDGEDGQDGKDGKPGKNGKDGKDGKDAELNLDDLILQLKKKRKLGIEDLYNFPARALDQRWHGGGNVIQDPVDLSDQLDGTKKTFTIPNALSSSKIVGVYSSSTPFVFRPLIDFTFNSPTITFAVGVDAPSMLAAGQSLIVTFTK